MVGEPDGLPVLPPHQPAPAQPRRPAIEPRLQLRVDRPHQIRTSTTGIDGISPAANPDRLVVIRSVSNRTGTSNSNPADDDRARSGRLAQLNLPALVVDPEPVPAARLTPSTATTTVPATGFAIARK